MTCKLTGKPRALRVVALFIVVLPALIVLAALAQQTGVSQPSGESSAASAPSGVNTPTAQAPLRPLLPGAGMAQRVSVGRLEGKKPASGPNATNPLFLSPVNY